MNYLSSFFSLLKTNKLKLIILLSSVVVFVFLLFPFGDLSDLVGGKVAEFTQNQFYISFSDLGISFSPFGVRVNDVSVDSTSFPTLNVTELAASPDVSAVFTQTPAGTIVARGIFRGDVELSIKSGTKSGSGKPRNKILIKADQLNLNELSKVAQLPMQLKGRLNLEGLAQADLTFSEQPEADINLTIEKFELPASSIESPMGPMPLPETKLSNVELKGKLAGGRFIIETGKIGKSGDDISGDIKGSIALTILNQNGVVPIFGGYDFNVNLDMTKAFLERADLFLTFFDQYKTATPTGARFSLKVQANDTESFPNMSAPR